MRNFYFILFLILLGENLNAQDLTGYNFQSAFESAYMQFPAVPKGMLEAVAFAQTRLEHIENNEHGCAGLPLVHGVMGLTEDGQNYFRDNLILVSNLSGISIDQIKNSPEKNILAYASAYNYLLNSSRKTKSGLNLNNQNLEKHELILRALSELPDDKNEVNQYALDCFTFEVFRFLTNPEMGELFHFNTYKLNLQNLYSENNYKILTADKVEVGKSGVKDETGTDYSPSFKSLDYPPALWVATPSCNYSSRSGTAISAVTVHTIQGSYAGAISWAQNCAANVSYHYVIRSSDGQVTQMVYESIKAWHVGSENPYTIGIEHEGYVSNPAWYTNAMYQSSANLVKDICNSGYGINPLRTFQGPATTGINVIGGCTKIKGHQHYPNQSHTDPGINWNWEYYYQLINDNPAITNLTASSGTFYDSGGPSGNYDDDERALYLIAPSSVVTVTISFASFSLENNWDYLYVYDGSSPSDPLLGVFTGTTLPSSITSTGPEILVEFRSDCATVSSGWQINWTSVAGPVPGDVIPPSSTVSFANTWQTADFITNFSDADNVGGSGVTYQTYQVIDFDGADWRANSDHGFFSDNFDNAIHPDWTSSTGNWSIMSGYLNQSDQSNSNTNIYASLNQNDHDVFLYQWSGKIGGTGTNKRVGLHFMCDDPALPNRGNSYFVWFREDDNAVQIYKVVNDVFTLYADVSYNLNANQWYDFKTLYDKNSGSIKVWINDVYVAGWVDSNPYQSGDAVSFRSGNAVYDVNDFKVYHDRGVSENVLVGTSGDLRYQNTNPSTPAGKIKSIVVDGSNNISSIGSELVNVDWTPSLNVSNISDGLNSDEDLFYSNTEISANWNSVTDLHSGIAAYWYAIGSSPGATDILDWTDNWFDTTFSHSGLSLVYGTTYYVSVKVENGAGLFSGVTTSDGQLLDLPSDPPVINFNAENNLVCFNDSLQMVNSTLNAVSYIWTVPGATPNTSISASPYFQFPVSGSYDVTLEATGPGGTSISTQTINVEVANNPVAEFTQSASILNLDYAFVTFTNNSINANGYSWSFGDGSISSDNEPWHEYSVAGLYNIMLIAVNGACPNDTAYSQIEIIETSGINENELSSFNIYPNPTEDNFVIYLPVDVAQDFNLLQIADASGKIIFNEVLSSNESKITLNAADLQIAYGVYFVSLKLSDQTITEILIVR